MRTADKGKRREGKLNCKAMFTKIYFNLGFVTESIRKYVHAKSYVYKVVADQIHNVYLMVKTFIRNGTHTYKKNTTQQSSIFVEEGLLMFFFFFFCLIGTLIILWVILATTTKTNPEKRCHFDQKLNYKQSNAKKK